MIHFSASRNIAGFDAAHRGVIDGALLNSWLTAVKYITLGKGGLQQHHWMPLPDTTSFTTATCWGFCQPIPCPLCCTFLAAMEKNVLHTLWQSVTENERTIFLLGQYRYISIQFGLTASIECEICYSYTVLRRSVPGEQVLCSLCNTYITFGIPSAFLSVPLCAGCFCSSHTL